MKHHAIFLAACAAVAAQVATATTARADARALHGLKSTVANLDRFGALPDRNWDGERVILATPSDTQYVRKHLARIAGDVAYADAYVRRLSTGERRDAGALIARVDHWRRYVAKVERSLESGAEQQSSGDAQCRAFSKDIQTNSRMASVLYVQGRSPRGGHGPKDLAEVVASMKVVAAACAKPEYKGVGESGCHWMKVGDAEFDPAMWCEAASGWRVKLKKRGDADVAAELARFRDMQFYAGAAANAEGWREIASWKDMFFADDVRRRYVERIDGMYRAIESDARVDPAMFAPIEKAFAELRADAEARASSWPLPKSAGSDYGAGLARKAARRGGAKVHEAFLSRASWKIHKNAIGVPLRRTRPGYVLMQPRGQKLCQLVGYTLTETFDGRRYQRAAGVSFGALRFQRCR